MYAHLLRGNRDIFVTALGGSSRAASGRPEAVADDERDEEVRLADNTCEAGEQSGPRRSRWREAAGPREMRNCKARSERRAGKPCHRRRTAYVELSPGTKRRSSQRSCTTSRSTSCGECSSN